jgi:hypothetical protein
MDDDTPVRLAYEASVRAISDQAAVLESLRSRAGTMFAAAALVTSFLGGDALAKPEGGIDVVSLTGAAFGSFVLASLLTIVILWPLSFWFSLSAAEILAIVDSRVGTSPVSGSEAYRELALRLETNYDHNAPRIKALTWCFRVAIIFLVVEVGLWISVLWRA